MNYMFDPAMETTTTAEGKEILQLGYIVYEDPALHKYMWEAWNTGQTQNGFDSMDNEFGHVYTYCVPLTIKGEKVGLLCSEISIEYVNSEISKNVIAQGLVKRAYGTWPEACKKPFADHNSPADGGAVLTKLDFNVLWRYFSWSNQTLAMISLWVSTAFLLKHKENRMVSLMTALPATFMLGVSFTYIMMTREGFRIRAFIAYPVGVILAVCLLGVYLRKLLMNPEKKM